MAFLEKLRHKARATIWVAFAGAVAGLLSGCQVNYLVTNGMAQMDLLMSRVPIEKALQDPKLTDEQKRKLKLAMDAHEFASQELSLVKNNNYTSYVQLNRPYVTYVVSAAEKNKLEHYLWSYPLVGSMPYRGYFDKEKAEAEQQEMKEKGYDTYLRGVTAFSTLGWFNDPILSSMLGYTDYDLVNTIIHETTHATIFVSSEADFNENLATYIGNKGTERFYLKREGENSATLKLIERENKDERLFSDFISKEIDQLEAWYKEREGKTINEDERQARLHEIQTRFREQVRPQVAEGSYRDFETKELNNAKLLMYRLYIQDLSEFDELFRKLNQDFTKMVTFCKSLEKQKDPKAFLHETVKAQPQ